MYIFFKSNKITTATENEKLFIIFGQQNTFCCFTRDKIML